MQIARKLVAAYESGAQDGGRRGRRFIVTLSAIDHARLEPDRAYLERQWRTMLGGLAERSGHPQRAPDVRTEIGVGVATGTATIVVEALDEPARLALRVRRGVPPNLSIALDRDVTIGRDPACDFVLVDPRVSRRHCSIERGAGGLAFRDLGSANGTSLNGVRRDAGPLAIGDVVVVGDCELVVEPAASAGADA